MTAISPVSVTFDYQISSNSVICEGQTVDIRNVALMPTFGVILIEDSPYPEVRCAVANFDDVQMPAATLRAWVLGMSWAILLAGVNQFYFFRYPSIVVPGVSA